MKIVLTDWQTVNEGALDLTPLEALGEVVAYPLTSDEQIADGVLLKKGKKNFKKVVLG